MISGSTLMESTGRSGSYFCPTLDARFFYKTIKKNEFKVMKTLAINYITVIGST